MFAIYTKIDPKTIEEPLSAYKTISALFNRKINLLQFERFMIRNLKYQLKNPQANVIHSPAQSVLSFIGNSQSVRVKGMQYTLSHFLSQNDLLQDKQYLEMVFYLSPGDYHNFHSPFQFDTYTIKHIYGTKWPVNNRYMKRVKGLLAENERVVMSGHWNGKRAWVIPVAALNVGCIEFEDFQLVSENLNKKIILTQNYEAGQMIGCFKFGSTVVVVLELEQNETWETINDGMVHVGESCVQIVEKQ